LCITYYYFFYEGWVWIVIEKSLNVSSYAFGGNEFATCGIFGRHELCEIRDGGGSIRKEEVGDERDLESFISFAEAKSLYETLRSFLCSHTTLAGVTSKTFRTSNWHAFA
jgi:hypothetical protein